MDSHDEIRIAFLTTDTPTVNGRVYPREVVERAIRDVDEVPITMEGAPTGGVIGSVRDINIDSNGVVTGTASVTRDFSSDLFTSGLFSFFSSGIGMISNNEVADFTLQSVGITPMELNMDCHRHIMNMLLNL